MLSEDYLELDLGLDYGQTATVIFYLGEGSPAVVPDVTGNPVRYRGVWSVTHRRGHEMGAEMTAYIDASQVTWVDVSPLRSVTGFVEEGEEYDEEGFDD